MTDGILAEWLVREGEVVTTDTVIYRLETDKVDTDVTAPASGTIRLIGTAGETYDVGTLIAEVT